MKNARIFCFVIVAALVATGGAGLSFAGQGQEYVTKIYPGAKIDPNDSGETWATFYTTDQIGKVLAFYGIDPTREAETHDDGGIYVEIISGEDVLKITGENQGETAADEYSRGVLISGFQQRPAGEDPAAAILNRMAGQLVSEKHTEADMATLRKKYDHLGTAIFMLSDPAGEDSAGRDKGDVLARKFVQKNDKITADVNADMQETADQSEVLVNQLQAAIAKGDMEEVQRLTAGMQEAAQGGSQDQTQKLDNWDDGVNALAALDAIDYRTRIVIATMPKAR